MSDPAGPGQADRLPVVPAEATTDEPDHPRIRRAIAPSPRGPATIREPVGRPSQARGGPPAIGRTADAPIATIEAARRFPDTDRRAQPSEGRAIGPPSIARVRPLARGSQGSHTTAIGGLRIEAGSRGRRTAGRRIAAPPTAGRPTGTCRIAGSVGLPIGARVRRHGPPDPARRTPDHGPTSRSHRPTSSVQTRSSSPVVAR